MNHPTSTSASRPDPGIKGSCRSDDAVSSMKSSAHLGFREEAGNAISHGVMMLFFLFALPYFAVHAWILGGLPRCVGTSIYTICMILMFGGSCLYHIMPYDTPWRYVFRKLDHISILLAIAGSYTPIILVLCRNWLGYAVLAAEWILVIAGIVLKSFSEKAFPKLSMSMYMTMGWLAVLLIPMLIKDAGWIFLSLIVLGGIFYSIGAIFYARRRPYDHFIWHLMILLASIAHMIAIVWFL